MHMPYGARGYVQTQARSSSPLELVVMLYDGAIRAVTTAHACTVARDLAGRRTALNKLTGILAELQSTLDMERGGDVARRLDDLYTYMLSRVMASVASQDPAPLDEVRGLLSSLAEAWRKIAAAPPDAAAAPAQALAGSGPGGTPVAGSRA